MTFNTLFYESDFKEKNSISFWNVCYAGLLLVLFFIINDEVKLDREVGSSRKEKKKKKEEK